MLLQDLVEHVLEQLAVALDQAALLRGLQGRRDQLRSIGFHQVGKLPLELLPKVDQDPPRWSEQAKPLSIALTGSPSGVVCERDHQLEVAVLIDHVQAELLLLP